MNEQENSKSKSKDKFRSAVCVLFCNLLFNGLIIAYFWQLVAYLFYRKGLIYEYSDHEQEDRFDNRMKLYDEDLLDQLQITQIYIIIQYILLAVFIHFKFFPLFCLGPKRQLTLCQKRLLTYDLVFMFLSTTFGIVSYWICEVGQTQEFEIAEASVKGKNSEIDFSKELILTSTMRNILNVSILLPIMAIAGFIFVLIIVLCVYLKEHFKINLTESLFRKETEEVQLENGIYNEMQDEEEIASIKGSPYYDRVHSNLQVSKDLDKYGLSSKREAMNFFLDMMPREVYLEEDEGKVLAEIGTMASPNTQQVNQMPSMDIINSSEERSHQVPTCNPLCEKPFKKGDVIRTILPCGHKFHEACIKTWLFRGENQYCPRCRGNIMKDSFKIKN